ncbi:hypothetical protein D9M70_442310 [compost metagenome]
MGAKIGHARPSLGGDIGAPEVGADRKRSFEIAGGTKVAGDAFRQQLAAGIPLA